MAAADDVRGVSALTFDDVDPGDVGCEPVEDVPWVPEREGTIEEQFEAFHAAHPEVYDELRRRALDLVERGHRQHLGIGMLWEVLRYHTLLGAAPDADEPFRLNNNLRSRYARLLMEREPSLCGVFEIRALRAD